MSDDQMRLQAVVVDGFTGPLKKLREDLRNAGQTKTAPAMEKDWRGVRKEIGGVVSDLNIGLAPALRGIGLRSLGVAGIIGGVALGIRNVATQGRSLKFMADQLGLSVTALQEIEALGKHFDIPTEQAESSLKTFANNLNQLKRRWGQAYNELRAMNLGGIAEDLINAPTLDAAFEKALEDLKKIPDPVYRRQIAQLLLGSDMWSVVATEMTPNLLARIKKQVGHYSAQDIKQAEQVVAQVKEFDRQWDALLLNLGAALPTINEGMRELNRLMQMLRNPSKILPHLKQELDESRQRMKDADERGQKVTLQDKLTALDKQIAGEKKQGVNTHPLELRRRLLIQEMERLRKSIEDANKNTLLQKESFTGVGGGLPRVIQASYHPFTGPLGGGAFRVRPPVAGAPMGSAASGGMTGKGVGHIASKEERAAFIRQAALERGIDPDIALRVAKSEGFNKYIGDRGTSFGDYQLHFKNNIPGLSLGGLGDVFKKKYGLDARDPRTWKQQVEFALDEAARGGWGPWHGWRGPRRAGLAGAHPMGVSPFKPEETASKSNMLDRAFPPLPKPAPHRVEGRASLDIHLHGLPSSARTQTAIEGMFREVRLTRVNQQMPSSADYVS